jgi:hypothetical protein
MRRRPAEGDDVTVVFLAVREHGVVETVEDDGRAVTVVTEEGAVLRFRLARGSAHYLAVDGSARLLLG